MEYNIRVRKIIFVITLLLAFFISGTRNVSAVGNCCNTDNQCDTSAGESCSGFPVAFNCTSKRSCQIINKAGCEPACPSDKVCTPTNTSGGQITYGCVPRTLPPDSGPSVLDCGGGKQGLNTAVGCIPFGDNTTSEALIGFILRWAIGVGGGIAFLLILYAGFQIMTSSGDPNKLKAGQELLTAAISGLIMLIFSTFILRVIGVDILKLG